MPNLNQYLLSEPRLWEPLRKQLSQLLNMEAHKLDEDELKKITYASWQRRRYYWTDQVFHGHWKQLLGKKEKNGWCYALLEQSARYHLNDDMRRLSVKAEKFDQWQTWISNQSGLPVIALQISKQLSREVLSDRRELSFELKQRLGRRSIISPYHPLVEDYINREGLHESHMHLNGTTLFEQLWHQALRFPESIIEEMADSFEDNERVQLLYASYPFLDSPVQLKHVLMLARQLRETLICGVEGEELYHESLSQLKQVLKSPSSISPVTFKSESALFDGVDDHWTHVEELNWQIRLLDKLRKVPSPQLDSCYLLYMLCMNCFQHLLVQRADQYGFDQFQKFADDGGREYVEKNYKARFFQLHGPHLGGRPDLSTLEGRFAPKANNDKNKHLLRQILLGFMQYAKGNSPLVENANLNELASMVSNYKRPNLRLVAHFIKQPWSVKSDGGYHFEKVREDLDRKAKLLFDLFDENPALRKVVTGIDAAANELETPPEVFAPLFRYCRFNKIRNFTYHVGEDFEHLLSGIRNVFDAVNLLDLSNGDRVGHATAIGIDPQLWLGVMPERTYLKQGEWLDNLLFLRKISLESSDSTINLGKLETKIRDLAFNIYSEHISIELLQCAWELRGLSPSVVSDFLDEPIGPLHHVHRLSVEFLLVKKVRNVDALRLFYKRSYDANVLENSEREIEISLQIFSFSTLLEAQQFTQAFIASRNVVIETLPTSNIRISHYKSIEQHHVFRWIQIPERLVVGDSKMLVSLGSDDPGIFATDMRNEFYHLFTALTHTFNFSAKDALGYVSFLNENGRIYRFDGPEQVKLLDEGNGLAER